jgi:hypothetical protein
MLHYLYRDVLNGFIVILILFSFGEIVTLISLNIAGMSVDPKGGYVFLQQIETYFAQFSFSLLHGIPRFLNLTTFRSLLVYFVFQLAFLIFLLRHLDSDQKEITHLKAEVANLTMTPAEKRKHNATLTLKMRKKFNKLKKKTGKWAKTHVFKPRKPVLKKKQGKDARLTKGKS